MSTVYDNGQVRLLQGDAIDRLRELPAESVHMAVCSPPYWGLRDYGTASWTGGDAECEHKPPTRARTERPRERLEGACGRCGAVRVDDQIGLEETPEAYVERLVEVFREVRRVLRADGTLWLNLGDSYSSGGRVAPTLRTAGHDAASGKQANLNGLAVRPAAVEGLAGKQLLGIPWRVALALQADGWWLRSEITWCKRASMPESVTDRPTSATEKVFLLAKAATYNYDADAVREEAIREGVLVKAYSNGAKNLAGATATNDRSTAAGFGQHDTLVAGRNMRNWWLLGPEPAGFAHYAVFPTEIPRRAILAGTSERGVCAECGAPWVREVDVAYDNPGNRTTNGPRSLERRHETAGFAQRLEKRSTTTGWRPTCDHDAPVVPCTVLDPFVGSGTTCLVATSLGRRSIGIDLNAEYLALAVERNRQMALL